MKRHDSLMAFALLFAIGFGSVCSAAEPDLHGFLSAHCFKCHGAKKQEADLRLDDLAVPVANASKNAKADPRWQAIRDQLRDGLMPPADEPRPDAAKVREVIASITALAQLPAARLPNQGNLIPHELLFGKPAEAGGASPDRAWRISPDAYQGFVRGLTRREKVPGVVTPFTLSGERGIRDYAGLYSVDEPSTETLLRNAAAIVDWQCGLFGKNDTVGEFVQLMAPDKQPTTAQLEKAVQLQFRMALGRNPNSDELASFLALYEQCAKAGDVQSAVKTMLQAVLLKTDALFRSEWAPAVASDVRSTTAATAASTSGRRLLAPLDLAMAISLSVGNRRDANLLKAAETGQLQSRDDVAAQLQKLFDDPKADRSRFMQFFREYFEYDKADAVFKDKPKNFMFSAPGLVGDTDRLVEHIVNEDRDVFRRLLTTDESFVNSVIRQNKQNKKELQRAQVPNPNNNKNQASPEAMYGLEDWPAQQPVKLPPNTRLGILMQPSWLVAWSTNFDNDPVRRGRWIRERLLGGTVPDLPIGVAAQVPNDPHRTYRDRLTVTRDEFCWKCHRRMDELGLAFEQFDHYGRFRTTEEVLDVDATEKNVDKKGNPLGKVFTQVTLNTSGIVTESGDASLDGPLTDPRELVRKLANSDRCRQVFVRHAFRFFLGRNETLSDARALQDADAAYVASGGSFKALVASLLTSDPFLYRIPSSTTQAQENNR